MKLVNLYLIGVIVMIGFLVASTMWQYSQFQTNVKNLSFNLPQELTGAMPNANEQLAQMMGQIQNQTQNQPATTTFETKQYNSPDNSFTFNYPADWIEQANNNSETIQFFASKIETRSTTPSISYLTIEKTEATSTAAIIAKLKNDIQSTKTIAKITESEIINSKQIIPVVEISQTVTEPITKTSITISNTSAMIATDNNFYILSIATQNDNQKNVDDRDLILKSIRINNQASN
jgi:hypothetical protein